MDQATFERLTDNILTSTHDRGEIRTRDNYRTNTHRLCEVLSREMPELYIQLSRQSKLNFKKVRSLNDYIQL